jgi:uncharacterized SAM-binding protein YcdF (DUF218 family)
MNDEISADQIAAITTYVDVEAPPPAEPTAHFIFGTNQATPAEIVADRYHQGLAPLVIATGGVNRYNGIVEGPEFRRVFLERGVPDTAVRCEDQSANTWQNVEMALPYLREAMRSGLPITAVCKWYHRRAIHALRTLLPDVDAFYAITWEPIYAGTPVTRTNWSLTPDGKRRVIRERQEIPRRVTDGTFKEANLINGAWR